MEPRPSSTVILARSAASDFELFMVRRHARARSFADAYVFPGGVVRADDFADQPGDLTPEGALDRFATRGGDRPTDAALALALHRAAARELFEEAGVLLAVDAAGRPAEVAEADRAAPGRGWAERRRAVQAGELTMAALLRDEGLSAALGQLRYFSHWITPLGAERRFDTRFFVVEMPVGQRAADCGVETFDGVWLRPREALGRYATGDLPLVFPTRMHLQRLTEPTSLPELLELARTKPVATVQPARSGQAVTATW